MRADISVAFPLPNGVTDTLVSENINQYGNDCNNLTNASVSGASDFVTETSAIVTSIATHIGYNYVYYEASENTNNTASLIYPATDLILATKFNFFVDHASDVSISALKIDIPNSATVPFTN